MHSNQSFSELIHRINGCINFVLYSHSLKIEVSMYALMHTLQNTANT